MTRHRAGSGAGGAQTAEAPDADLQLVRTATVTGQPARARFSGLRL